MKTGDIVILKSGGPKMTVAKVGEFMKKPGRQTALCTWFDSDDKHNQEFFELGQLTVLEENKDGA